MNKIKKNKLFIIVLIILIVSIMLSIYKIYYLTKNKNKYNFTEKIIYATEESKNYNFELDNENKFELVWSPQIVDAKRVETFDLDLNDNILYYKYYNSSFDARGGESYKYINLIHLDNEQSNKIKSIIDEALNHSLDEIKEKDLLEKGYSIYTYTYKRTKCEAILYDENSKEYLEGLVKSKKN